MSRVREHVIANFSGQAWTALLGLLVVPVYIRLLGIEAYGLIGLYATTQMIISVLDLGLSPMLNRELARYSSTAGSEDEARDLVRTMEAGYWAIGILVMTLFFLAARVLASDWIRSEGLPEATVLRCLQIMALATGIQWPLSMYQGGLMGLQRPGLLQAITAGAATLKTAGAALILWKVSASVTVFFAWQAFATAVQLAATTSALWLSLPGSRRPRVDTELLRSRWRFAAGIGATTAVTLLLTQLDKIVLSKLVSLPLFGFYALAGTMADALYKLVTPIHASFFPQFSILVARGDHRGLVHVYHRSCQLVSVLLLPTALVIIAFSHELVALWTGSADAAGVAGPVVAILTAGTALNGLMSLPYALQLAHGWVRLSFLANLTGLIVLGPSVVWLVVNYGLSGAAFGWVLLNLGYVLIEVPIMHRRILRGEWHRWLWSDVMMPLLPALLVVASSRLLLPPGLSALYQAAVIVSVTVAGIALAALGASEARAFLRRRIKCGLHPKAV